ncbi:MAG: hypothetical protein A2W90_20095 [Bacteroidetes bacterium GWF2_42_66]|nr:MAG: hypothetical protein A2W92_12935 [Bacteroidetes bacterium GWA2_42_15]OFX98419.1 MAG: hypothetical protein A2W89_08460 [Bacteroidetes bacterium GWE2_42_39]OFY42804.1 MAG: hypothetical protein A2W90_20095 [Bacteroidetes bacterium GWF2_42_66]HBL74426.1 hypothetical protein [Prolixibacteraceae bacterium]HCR90951.1 hypothetical protein [Prolixibacteraceae bacterium]
MIVRIDLPTDYRAQKYEMKIGCGNIPGLFLGAFGVLLQYSAKEKQPFEVVFHFKFITWKHFFREHNINL